MCSSVCFDIGRKFGVPAADTAACSGIAFSMPNSLPRLSASCDTVFLNPSNASPSSPFSEKLPRLSPALLSRFKLAMPLPTPSPSSAMPPGRSTDTKLALTFDVGLLFSLSVNALVDRPRVSGEFSGPLFSKIERRLRTAEDDRFSDMAIVAGVKSATVKAGAGGLDRQVSCTLSQIGIVVEDEPSQEPSDRAERS